MPRYAQVNIETGIIESDSILHDVGMEKKFPNMIPIPESFDLSQKRWDFEKKDWVEYILQPELSPQPLSEQEQIDIDTALNVEYIACLMEASLA